MFFYTAFTNLLYLVGIKLTKIIWLWCLQINVDVDRTVVALYKFLKKNASIPFKIQKPTSAPKMEKPTSEPKAESSDIKESHESSSDKDVKDEL